jgi:hypothetical protein
MILPWLKKKKTRDLSGSRVRMWIILRAPTFACTPQHLVVVNLSKDKPNGNQDSTN